MSERPVSIELSIGAKMRVLSDNEATNEQIKVGLEDVFMEMLRTAIPVGQIGIVNAHFEVTATVKDG